MENLIKKGDVFHTNYTEFIAIEDETKDKEAKCKCTFSNGNGNFKINDEVFWSKDSFYRFGVKSGKNPFNKTDTVVESVIDKFKQRSEAGIKKYGTTLDRNDLTLEQWINHVQEELMDAVLYLQKLKTELPWRP